MTLPGAPELLRRIVRMPECRAWHTRGRVRVEVDVRVAQQRQNRVIERRGRQFHLPALCGVAILGNDPAKDLELDLAQLGFVGFAEAALLLHEPAHARVGVQVERIDPRQLVPYLQVEKILVRVSPAGLPLLQELGVARISIDHSPARGVEEFGERDRPLVIAQLVRRLHAELEVPVPRALLGERLELHEQRGDQVERELHLRKLAQQRGHPVVVLQTVHPHPREDMLARGEVFVVRLVHVPEDGDVSHDL